MLFKEVEGMKLLEGQSNEEKTDSINGTIHRVTVVNPSSFKIGDTSVYSPYERNGIASQMKVKGQMKFKSLKEAL